MSAPKNILLISLDDAFAYWKYRSAFGVALETPNLDRICAQSTAFHSAYCQVPVCGPSRSSMMSGLSPHQLGIFDNYTNVFSVLRPEQMWPYRLKAKGYYCAAGGKVHHGYKPLPAQIHNVLYSHPPQAFNIGPGKNAKVVNFGGLMKGLGTIDPAYDNRYYDAQSAASAAHFFETYDRQAPFYKEVGFYHPHSPYKTPIRFKEMYKSEAFQQPSSWAGGYDKGAFPEIYMRENIDASNLEMWQKSVRNYFSAFSHVDEHLGRVWDALKASPHADNTIVIILADHGYHPGDKNRFRKYTLYEEAAGVPLIIHDPAQSVAREITDPVALLDVGMTVLDYAQIEAVGPYPGRSLRPQVAGATIGQDRSVPTFFYGSASIRKGDYRYMRYQDGSEQLFHLPSDPWQLRDLAASDPARDEMSAALAACCLEHGLRMEGAVEPDDPRLCDYSSLPDPATSYDHLPARGCMSDGTVPTSDASPMYRRHFATLSANGSVALPDSLRAINLAADYRIGAEHFGILGNDLGNEVNFIGGHNRFLLDIVCGTGDDRILGHLDQMRLSLTDGDNEVRTGHSGSVVMGGAGHDRITVADGTNTLHGGSGRADILLEKGTNTITPGDGRNNITCLDGENEIILDAGITHVSLHAGFNTLIVRRTGLPQSVTGFRGGRIDLSDWAALPRPEIRESAECSFVIQTGAESVTFYDSDKEALMAALALAP